MTHQQIMQFGPLLLALYEAASTLLYVLGVGRMVRKQSRPLFHPTLVWLTSIIIPGVPFVRWYAGALGIDMHRGDCSAEQAAQMLGLFLLVVFVPYAVIGFIACNCPSLWHRFNSVRTSPNNALQRTEAGGTSSLHP